ncbi:MAG: flagellar assembly protein FliH [Undibacterium sp.]|nr:flagellar assembly protein FliH [Undibacterium sp.]
MSDILTQNQSQAQGQQTAYQRWEMASFGDARPAQLERTETALRVSEEELERIRAKARKQAYAEAYQQAYQEAYDLGHQEGKELGYAETLAQSSALIDSISEIKQQFITQLRNAHQEIGQDFIGLAVELASAMCKMQFELKPETIFAVIKAAIEKIPAISQPAQIFLHPEDVLLVKESLGPSLESDGWKLLEDEHLDRGGCRVETAKNVQDASYQTRWTNIVETLLGVDSNAPREH